MIVTTREMGDACWGACQEGDLEKVKSLVQAELEGEANTRFKCRRLTRIDQDHPTCLLEIAVVWDRVDIVEWLIDEAGVEVEDEDSYFPPLHRACYYGLGKITEVLLSRGANPCRVMLRHVGDKIGKTPLEIAAKSRYGSECVLALNHYGVDLNGREELKFPPLQLALSVKKNRATALTFIESGECDLNLQRANGPTPFEVAWFRQKNVELATELLRRGARVEPHRMMHPFLVARQGASPTIEMMQLMIEQNKQIPHNPFQYDDEPHKRRDYRYRQQTLIGLVREALPDLHYACYLGNLYAVQLFLEDDEGDNSYGSPLAIAAANGHRKVVAFLLDEAHPTEGLLDAIEGDI